MATGQGRTGVTARVAARVMLFAALAGFAVVGLGSSAKTFTPGRNDFTTRTHIGKIHVFIDVKKVNGQRQLQGVKIWVGDKPLELPTEVDLRVPDPKIKRVTLISTASFSCIGDPCVDDSPAMLFIPFGKTIRRDSDKPDAVTGTTPCNESYLSLHIYPEEFGAITQYTCSESGEVRRVLFEPK
jgi:hypothetical protein